MEIQGAEEPASPGLQRRPLGGVTPKAARGGQSLNVRLPEIMVDTMDWRPMMSSRIAA